MESCQMSRIITHLGSLPCYSTQISPNKAAWLPTKSQIRRHRRFTVSAVLPFPALAIELAVDSSGASETAASAATQVLENVETATEAAAKGTGEAGNEAAVSILGTVALIGLIFLTIAVAYLSITDYLDKRARDEETKQLLEEAKKQKKRKPSPVRGGAKGFGQRLQDED